MCRTGEARAQRAEYRRQTEGVHSAGTGRRTRATGGPGRRHGVRRPRGCRTDDGPLIRFATGRAAGRRGAAAVAVRRGAARSLQESGGDGTDAEQYRDGTGQCGTGTASERCPLADQPPEGIRTGPDETIHALLLCGSGHPAHDARTTTASNQTETAQPRACRLPLVASTTEPTHSRGSDPSHFDDFSEFLLHSMAGLRPRCTKIVPSSSHRSSRPVPSAAGAQHAEAWT